MSKFLRKNHFATQFILISFIIVTLTVWFACQKENTNDNETLNLSESESVQDAKSDSYVNTAAIGLLNLSKNSAFREIVHTECAKQFDGDFNVLLSDLRNVAGTSGIDLKNNFLESISENAEQIYSKPIKPDYGFFTNQDEINDAILGYKYFENTFSLQIYVPNFETSNVTNKQPIVVVYPEDVEGCKAFAYEFDENMNWRTIAIDNEEDLKDKLVWVVSINERIGAIDEAPTSKIVKGDKRVEPKLNQQPASSASKRDLDTKNIYIDSIMIENRNEGFFGGRADVYVIAAHIVNCKSLSNLATPSAINFVKNKIGKFGKFKLNRWCCVDDLPKKLAWHEGGYISPLQDEEDLAFVIYEQDAEKKKNLQVFAVCDKGYEMKFYSKNDPYITQAISYFDLPNQNPNKAGTWEDYVGNDIVGTNGRAKLKGRTFRF